MDRFDRIYALHKIISNAHYPVSRKTIQEKLECSRATFTRIVEDLRDFLGAPIVYDRKYNGYCYDQQGEHPYELPGLWFNASEIHALLVCQELLRNVEPGFLDESIRPLRKRVDDILTAEHISSNGFEKRIKILRMAHRTPLDGVFQIVAEAAVQQKRLLVKYHGRERNGKTEREVSPQRLVYYRDNWYLDGWCHLRNGLRSFSVDRILDVQATPREAKQAPEKKLDDYFTTSYGIFSGKPGAVAVLRFSETASPWVASERWHPDQQEEYVDGRLELKIPFSDARELLHDILKYGEQVEVLSPESLRNIVIGRLEKALKQYMS